MAESYGQVYIYFYKNLLNISPSEVLFYIPSSIYIMQIPATFH